MRKGQDYLSCEIGTGKIDFLLYLLVFASPDDLNRDTIETSREGFKMAMDIVRTA